MRCRSEPTNVILSKCLLDGNGIMDPNTRLLLKLHTSLLLFPGKVTSWKNFEFRSPRVSHCFLHLLVYDKLTQKFAIISVIYAPTQEVAKQDFWECLHELSFVINLSLHLIGDFNEMDSPLDKIGGNPLTQKKIARLSAFLSASRMTSIDTSGHHHT